MRKTSTRTILKVLVYDFGAHPERHERYLQGSDGFVRIHARRRKFPGDGEDIRYRARRRRRDEYKRTASTGAGEKSVLEAFDLVVEPAARRFQPDLIVVSAGYGAHWRDPLANLNFRSRTYHYLSSRLKKLSEDLCDGKIVFLLEGGYDLTGLPEGGRSFSALV